METGENIKRIGWESIMIVIVVFIVLLLLLNVLGIINFNGNVVSGGDSKNVVSGDSNIPEKCKVPAGQDVNSWKEHLGHHAETQDCLKYFN